MGRFQVFTKLTIQSKINSIKEKIPDIDIQYNGTTKDWSQFALGVVGAAAGVLGLFGPGAAELLSGGAATPGAVAAVSGSVAAITTGGAAAGAALGNMFDVTIYKSEGNNLGGKESDSSQPNSEGLESPNDGGSKTIDDLINGLKETTNGKGIARNFEASGGYEQTLKDFEALSPTNVKDIKTKYGSGKVGTLSDGTKVVARQGSTTGGATLEIKVSNSKVYKIRY